MATINTILGSDTITSSRTVINANFTALNSDKIETSVLDTDTALTNNSDIRVATQKAVKAYVDAGGNVNASETTRGIVEEATDAEVTTGTAVGVTGAKLFVTPAKLAAYSKITEFTVSGTYTRPAVNKMLFIEVIGGGGSGGAANAAADGTSAATGGGGGEYRCGVFPSSVLTATVAITIPAASVARTTSGRQAVAGAVGGNTSFGAYLIANGGAAGSATIAAGTGIATAGAVVGGTSGTTAVIAVTNENGAGAGSAEANGTTCASTVTVGGSATNSGAGGGSANGNTPCLTINSGAGGVSTNAGAGGAGSNTTATAGSSKGGGGGGAAHRNAAVTSGAGGQGFIRITEFL